FRAAVCERFGFAGLASRCGGFASLWLDAERPSLSPCGAVAIRSGAVAGRDGAPAVASARGGTLTVMTVAGGGWEAANPGFGVREGCMRKYKPSAKQAPTAQ